MKTKNQFASNVFHLTIIKKTLTKPATNPTNDETVNNIEQLNSFPPTEKINDNEFQHPKKTCKTMISNQSNVIQIDRLENFSDDPDDSNDIRSDDSSFSEKETHSSNQRKRIIKVKKQKQPINDKLSQLKNKVVKQKNLLIRNGVN